LRSNGSPISLRDFRALAADRTTGGQELRLPITQMDLAATTGLLVVHVNRTIQELRASNLIVLCERTLTINDLEALKKLALFSPSYLHLRAE
jgi:CRP-like cAMP-binding protein